MPALIIAQEMFQHIIVALHRYMRLDVLTKHTEGICGVRQLTAR